MTGRTVAAIADAWTATASPLVPDDREGQCKRAADYMEVHPGCSLVDLASGADLGSASKVVSEMRHAFGYGVRRVRVRVPCRDGQHARTVTLYWLESRPSSLQCELFTNP